MGGACGGMTDSGWASVGECVFVAAGSVIAGADDDSVVG